MTNLDYAGALIDVDIEEFKRVYDTNVFAVIRMAKAVIPHMASRKRGTIVNIGSIAGDMWVPWTLILNTPRLAILLVLFHGVVHIAQAKPQCIPSPTHSTWNANRLT